MDFSTAVIDAARNWACRNLDTADALQDYFDELEVADASITAPIAAISTPINNFGRWLYQCPASQGPYPVVSPEPPPFTGGQCQGTAYNVTVNVIRNGVPLAFTDTRLGPIGVPRYEQDGASWRGRWYRPDGTTTLWSFDSISTGFPQPEIVSFGINFVAAGPDDCGDLSTGTEPPPDISYDAPDGTPVVEPVNIDINAPVILNNGGIVVPVSITGPNWSLRVDFPGDDTPRISPTDSPVGENVCCPDEVPDSDVPEGDEPEPPDGDRAIVGVVVVVNTPDVDINSTQVFVVGGPVLHFPRLGSILFAVKKGGTRAWMNPVAVQTRRAYIPVPSGENAVAAIAAPQNNAVLTITPVYATIEPSEGSGS